ncbi:MAG: SGNH/GDSL hydrolase family protein [Phycisphaerales bacterium]
MAVAEGQAAPQQAGPVRLILPPVIYAVPGIECNIYFDNIILALDRDNYAFDVDCVKGMQLSERWTCTPGEKDIGEYLITIRVLDSSNALVASAESVLHVSPDALMSGGRATLLIVGASFTEYSIYPRHILDLSRRGGPSGLKLIGSRGSGNMPPTDDLRHEGYSGWTAQAFATKAGPLSRSGYHHRPGTGSPFVYSRPDGSSSLDFAAYCREFNDGVGPDMVTIQVGTNDVFSATDETIDRVINEMFTHYEALIASIHEARSDTHIGVVMVTPPSASQDGFRNYRGAGKQTRWQLRRNQHRLMERMLEHFVGREDENVFFLPSYLNLDCEVNFPTWTAARNARSKDPTTRVNNGTHPSEAGYQQIGDGMYAWVCAQMQKRPPGTTGP